MSLRLALLAVALSSPVALAETAPLPLRDGADLGTKLVDPSGGAVSQAVRLPAGAVVLATYVAAREHSTGGLVQRDNLGFWHAWDGDPATRIDNRLPVVGGPEGTVVDFKLFAEPLTGRLFPIRVLLTVETEAGPVRGTLTLMPAEGGR